MKGNLVFSRCGRECGVTAGIVSAVAFPWSSAAWAPFVFVPCFFLPFHGPGGGRDVCRIALVMEPWRATTFFLSLFCIRGSCLFRQACNSVFKAAPPSCYGLRTVLQSGGKGKKRPLACLDDWRRRLENGTEKFERNDRRASVRRWIPRTCECWPLDASPVEPRSIPCKMKW